MTRSRHLGPIHHRRVVRGCCRACVVHSCRRTSRTWPLSSLVSME